MLALALQVALRLYPPAGPPTVRLTLLDVGQGEAIFLEVPDWGRILVDAGGLPGDRFDMGMRVVAPYLWHEWVGRLDVLVVTHPQSDHIGGVPAILRNFPVGEVWTGEGPSQSAVFLWMQEYLREQRIPHRVVSGGGPPVRWGEASLEVLHPQPRRPGRWPAVDPRPFRPNDASLVLKVRIGTQAALLTGDIERDGEAALVRSGASLHAQVLKVPHHGSRTSSAEALIAAVGPEVALVSAGYRNRFRHPHPEVVQRYQAAGARILRTDLNGAITVEMTPEGVRAWGRREGS
jgi:competence protein ComEC